MPEESAQPLIEADVVGRLMGQPLLARFPMEGSVSGHHRSPHRGSSVEFAEYRNYVPGDDIRRLDWRVFARTDRYYLKEFEAETNLRCYVVLDCSGSMAFEVSLRPRATAGAATAAVAAAATAASGLSLAVFCSRSRAAAMMFSKCGYLQRHTENAARRRRRGKIIFGS